MMLRTRRRHSRMRRRRRGLTLIELLTGLAIVSLLLSLLLPAIGQARGAARRVQCQNHQRQLALALIQQTDQTGRLPATGHFAVSGARGYHSWVTTILPQLEQAALYGQYDFSQTWDAPENRELTRRSLELLQCPDDISCEPGAANLSYVVNSGWAWTIPIDCPASWRSTESGGVIAPLDLNGDGVVCPLDAALDAHPRDIDILLHTSLFFVENWPLGTGTRRSHRWADITDGLSQTILLGENVRAGFDPAGEGGWGSPDPRRTAFFLSSRVCPDRRCRAGDVDLSLANLRGSADSNVAREAINGGVHQPEGASPFLSSLHGPFVHVAYCDGRVSVLSEAIDGAAFARLATPQGGQLRGPLGEARRPADWTR